MEDDKLINLLVIGDSIKGVKNLHYVYIKNLSIFASKNKRNADGKHQASTKYTCGRCLHPFSSNLCLEKHKKLGCDLFEPTKVEIPSLTSSGKAPVIEFENFHKKFKAPVAIYADFETFIQPADNTHDQTKSSTTKLADLPPCSYAFNIVSDYPELNLGYHSYRGEDAVNKFLTELLKKGDEIREVLDYETPMIITPEQEKEFHEQRKNRFTIRKTRKPSE